MDSHPFSRARLAVVFVGLLICPAVHAAPQGGEPPGKPSATGGGLALSLRDAILQAFGNHPDIHVARLNQAMRGADIAIASSPFDPRFVSGVNYSRSEIPIDDFTNGRNELGSIENENWRLSGEVNQTFYTGTRAALSLGSTFDRGETFIGGLAINDRSEIRPRLGFTVTQPLLKGFSLQANTADIRLATVAYSISALDFRLMVENVVSEVERLYWDAVHARGNLSVQGAAVDSAQEVLNISEARLRVGDVAELEVWTARANLATQEEGRIRARNDLANAEDRLAQIILRPEWRRVGRRAILTTDEPDLVEEEVDLERSLERALERRPDLRRSERQLEQARIQHRKAKHELLPTLNLTGTVGTSGLGKDPGNALSEMFTGEFIDWGVGLSLEVPLGANRFAEGNLKKLKHRKEQAQVALNSLKAGIIYEVRQAVRGVASARERVRAAEAARELSERRLRVEQAKLREGATIAKEVLDVQEDLLAARSAELRARIDYRLALSLLKKSESTILSTHGVRLPDENE
ncbi:MAG: TolC family protein [Planctomycetota bacterium]|nr:TolC family protein [Planctomycetota bacterium]